MSRKYGQSSIRIPPDIWTRALTKARSIGQSRNKVVVALIKKWLADETDITLKDLSR